MNYRQFKKKVYKKSVPHRYWRNYKKKLRTFLATLPTKKPYPNRKRIRQL